MTARVYSAYQDSGTEWLPSFPQHWRVQPFWTLFRRSKQIGFEERTLLSVYRDHGVVAKDSRTDNNNKASEDLGAYQAVEIGNLVINKMKAWQGSVAISPLQGIVSPAYFVYKNYHNECGKFLHYLFRSQPYVGAYFSMSKGVRPFQWDLDPQQHNKMQVVLPPKFEQAAIAAFLDCETGKIDALVAEQELLIALLREKRQAVISYAVTKGLEPDIPMKDSGVPWLGLLPATWIACRIGYFATVENGSTPDRENQLYWTGDCSVPWITSGEVNQYVVSEPSEFITPLALEQSSLRVIPEGALLVGLVGQGRRAVQR